MADQSGRIDLTTLIAALNEMTQVLGTNGTALAGSLRENLADTESDTTITGLLGASLSPAKWAHFSGAGTHLIKPTSARLLSVNFNALANNATVTIYNSALITPLPAALIVAAFQFSNGEPFLLPIGPANRGLTLSAGLVVAMTGAADLTISYV